MIVGYGRTSTTDQVAGLDAQTRDLQAAGVERIFSEQVSSVVARPELAAALDFVRDGDTFMVSKIDRLARSTSDLLAIVERLRAKGVALRILNPGIDTGSAIGKMFLTMLGAVAEFERSIMLERQVEGIAKARAAGRYKGRQPTARAKSADVLRLHADGVGASDIARQVGIGRASVYRILDDAAD